MDVVLDLSFWSWQMRDDYRRLLRPLGVEPETIYLATRARSRSPAPGPERLPQADDFPLSEPRAARYFDGFEAPTPAEGPLTVLE